MSTTTASIDCNTQAAPIVSAESDDPVRISVRSFVSRMFPNRLPVERRKDGRYPYPFLLRLTPVDAKSGAPSGEHFVVVGKDLSERGFGFFHQFPLTQRRVIATFCDPAGQSISLLVDVSWCRFKSQGWYESGGRFLRVVATPPTTTERSA